MGGILSNKKDSCCSSRKPTSHDLQSGCSSCHSNRRRNGYNYKHSPSKASGGCDNFGSATTSTSRQAFSGNSLVLYRWSSMFFDDDGDLAHEFYEELPCRSKGRRPTLAKLSLKNLRQQGWVAYDFPRLHSDLPYVLIEATSISSVLLTLN